MTKSPEKERKMTDFNGVVPTLVQALKKRGYASLTPVQTAVLDPSIGESDLLVSAQTGSGKTVAFGISFSSTLLGDAEKFGKVKTPLALVIAPTRELALQVKRELEWLYESTGANVVSCVGGMDMRKERQDLARGAHIVVGTPGRLCDHIKRGSFDTSGLKAAVLDEADEMLDMGFREELEYILDTAPKERRTLLFSATVPKTILSMAKRFQNEAKRITTKEEQKQHSDIEYHAHTIAPSDKENAIINLLRFHEAKNTIIFCGTRAAVNHLNSRLNNRGFSVVSLSGELSQNERSNALQSLRDGRARVCVATDVAARGIDLPGLELVIHADIPKNRDLLLHRSGRTGRAGCKGVSALVVPHNMRGRAERLLKSAKLEAAWKKPPSIKEIETRDRERFLADPTLSDPIKEEEKAFAQDLITRYGAEQLAAALMRVHNSQKPAPEELLDAMPADRAKKSRETFKDGVWIELNVGRKANVEPRWLLPLLCGAGHLTKRQIGSIRIQPNKTHIEISAECADQFFDTIGSAGTLEKNIKAKRFEGTPPEEERRERPSRDGKRSGKPSGKFSGSRDGQRSGGGRPDKRSDRSEGFKKKRDGEFGGKPKGGKPYKDKTNGDKPWSDKPQDGFKKKKKNYSESDTGGDKKPWEKNSDGDAPRKAKPSKNNDGDMPRKKSKGKESKDSLGPRKKRTFKDKK